MTRRRTNLRWRSPAILVPLWIALVTLVAPILHLHVGIATSGGSLLMVRRYAAVSSAVRSGHPAGQTAASTDKILSKDQSDSSADDCPLCQWLSGVSYCTSSAAVPLCVLLTACALLLLQVRLAALCARPIPWRGLRAPPVCFAFLA